MAKGNRGPRGALVGIQQFWPGNLITDILHLYIFVVISLRAFITDTPVSACMRKVLWFFLLPQYLIVGSPLSLGLEYKVHNVHVSACSYNLALPISNQ